MAAYVQQNNSRRLTVLAVIIVFHLLLLYGLVTGLARKVVEVVAAPLQTDIIEELQKEDKPPPPPPPQMERPPVEVPPPEVSIDIPMESSTTAITDVTDRPVPVAPPPPPPPAAVNRVAPKLDVRRSPPTDDFYPPSARRAEIEGVTTVRACVTPDGRTSGEPSATKSSGNSSLDEAAIKWAKRARWSAGTEDGKPVEMCSQFNVRFKLTD
jgi:periplasmic protein TonB